MPSAAVNPLSEELIDDLVYLSRVGELEDFQECIESFAKSSKSSHLQTIIAAVDEESGNSPLHMASANGHLGILHYLSTIIQPAPPDLRASILNLQNRSGNTALHWAALNGHIEAVKILVAAGADPSVTNQGGHDAVYEAEINSKDAVVEWLLKEGTCLETSVAGEEKSAAALDLAGIEEDDPVGEDSGPTNDAVRDEEDDHEIDQRTEKLTIE